jgi:hypothetical protein
MASEKIGMVRWFKRKRERAREDRVLDDEAAKRQGGKSTKAGNSSTIPNGIGKLKGCDWA